MTEKENKYLSLKAAAQLYGYTRDHLGLMIRQGKLNGVRLGSYYVVTNECMLKYIKNFADPSHHTSKSKMSNKFLIKALISDKKIQNSTISGKGTTNKGTNRTALGKSYENNLERELSEELSLLSALKKYPQELKKETYIDTAKKSSNLENSELKSVNQNPYIILPIREMNMSERENILNRILNKEVKKDIV